MAMAKTFLAALVSQYHIIGGRSFVQRPQHQFYSTLREIIERSDNDPQRNAAEQTELTGEREDPVNTIINGSKGQRQDVIERGHQQPHRDYPKVILQADRLGRSAHAQISRLLPNNQSADKKQQHQDQHEQIQPQQQSDDTQPQPTPVPSLVSATVEWKRLEDHAAKVIQPSHLRDLLQDPVRCAAMYAEHDGVYLIQPSHLRD